MDISQVELLEQFLHAVVIAVYRCSRVVDNVRTPTESVIAKLADSCCPSEIRVWPLIYIVPLVLANARTAGDLVTVQELANPPLAIAVAGLIIPLASVLRMTLLAASAEMRIQRTTPTAQPAQQKSAGKAPLFPL